MTDSANERPANAELDAGAGPADPDELNLAIETASGRGALLRTLAVFGAFVAALALIPMALGFGPFGARLIVSGEIPVHVLNLSGTDLEVSLSFSSDRTIPGGTMETMETLSGPFHLRTVRPDGEVLDDLDVEAEGPVFYNAGGGRCFAVFDISGFYDGSSDGDSVSVVARLDESTRVYVFDADTVVLPQRTAPDQARGRVHWLEPVGCGLLDPEEESFLIGQNLVRMQQRRESYEERLREAREAQ